MVRRWYGPTSSDLVQIWSGPTRSDLVMIGSNSDLVRTFLLSHYRLRSSSSPMKAKLMNWKVLWPAPRVMSYYPPTPTTTHTHTDITTWLWRLGWRGQELCLFVFFIGFDRTWLALLIRLSSFWFVSIGRAQWLRKKKQ